MGAQTFKLKAFQWLGLGLIAFGDCLNFKKNYGRTKFKVILSNDVHIPIIRVFRKKSVFEYMSEFHIEVVTQK